MSTDATGTEVPAFLEGLSAAQQYALARAFVSGAVGSIETLLRNLKNLEATLLAMGPPDEPIEVDYSAAKRHLEGWSPEPMPGE